jgi:phosphoglycolate phosphatase
LRHVAPSLAPEQYPALGNRYRHHYFASQHELSLFPGAVEMLRSLKARHHWLVVATGKGRQGLNDALAHAELQGVFDGSRTADETASKPHPMMLEQLMQQFGAAPERTLMIGDTTHDLQLARNAGTPCVAVSFGAHEPDTFAEFEPLFIAHSTRELHDWLVSHG